MATLADRMVNSSDFLIGVEMVSVRGAITDERAVKAQAFAGELVDSPDVDWVSVTDNAGGNPQLEPHALAKPMLSAGKDVVIHLTCKDRNRNGLESLAWFLSGEGFHNILAMTGDYPVSGNGGPAKPVFDIDSVGLITMLADMNQGLEIRKATATAPARRLEKTKFLVGAVTTNFKLHEGEVMPQYMKLRKKVECGAQFIINQIGYDARKMHELMLYMAHHGMRTTPLIGNVYNLTARVAEIFNQMRIPGVVVTDPLLALCQEQGKSADKGKAFFYELSAKLVAIYRGLGYRGAYLGGVHSFSDVTRILEIEKTFSADDWKQFGREISFSRPDEFFYYGKNVETGLADERVVNPRGSAAARPVDGLSYRFSKWVHDTMFTADGRLAKWGAGACSKSRDPLQGPKLLRGAEHVSKSVLFACKDCGDCSLPDIAFLCPESQCAKNQRNGPCGGTRDGRCEVDGYGDCIWLRAYNRLPSEEQRQNLLAHAPVIQNQGLRGTSSWANNWLGRDHASKPKELPEADTAQAVKSLD